MEFNVTNLSDDFNPKQAYESLSANIEQPDKFAQLFCKAAASQKSIDNVLKKTFRNLLSKDHQTIERVKQLQREINKEDWRSFLNKIGWTGWALIWAIFGGTLLAVAQAISKKYLGL